VPGDDIADDKSMIFTEAEIFMLAGYLADEWGATTNDVVADTEEAIRRVLEKTNVA
jgi:hypothetical protein